MNKSFMNLVITLGVLLLITSCGSLPYQQSEDDVYAVVDALSGGDSDELLMNSQVPFLLNGEIIMMKDHLDTFWDVLSENGFVLSNPLILANRALEEGDSLLFAKTQEVAFFFEKYTNQDTSFVELHTDQGGFYLLLGRRDKGISRLIGIKGPM